jgi:hypothetical protein
MLFHLLRRFYWLNPLSYMIYGIITRWGVLHVPQVCCQHAVPYVRTSLTHAHS